MSGAEAKKETREGEAEGSRAADQSCAACELVQVYSVTGTLILAYVGDGDSGSGVEGKGWGGWLYRGQAGSPGLGWLGVEEGRSICCGAAGCWTEYSNV